MADGFLGRWSRRKLEVNEGRAVQEESPQSPAAPAPESGSGTELPVVAPSQPGVEGLAAVEPRPPEPPPTLADVAGLTPDSDFRRFITRDVAPDVKSAALKKLFADPHFNVMDRLDTYIDDYSQPDPIPASMLRQLVSAQFLGLLREEERASDAMPVANGTTDGLPARSVAQSNVPQQPPAADIPACPSDSVPDPDPDAYADLRLQQDDAPGGRKPGGGAG
ncbi:MAG: DUF3306 domain-containing protein [Ramlibacter sp.]